MRHCASSALPICFIFLFQCASGETPNQRIRAAEDLKNLPLAFEENRGQAGPGVDFVARGGHYAVALEGGDARIALQRDASASSAIIDLRVSGSRRNAQAAGRKALPGQVNYFIGNDPSRWRTGIATFAQVEYKGIYPGVDLVYYGHQGQLEYDFRVAPGAQASRIDLKLRGARGLRVDAAGDLVLDAPGGAIRFLKPLSYQQIGGVRRHVESRYQLAGPDEVRFALGAYDSRYPLVIDPSLAYSTYLGGSGFDYGTAIAVSSGGNAYVTGYTSSLDFPMANPEQSYFSGSSAVFVAELASNGKSLVYSTYLGGSEYTYPYSIAVDSTGAAYVVGLTEASDFPVKNALYSALNGSEDAFITKFGPAGNTLTYSTYLGGSGVDYALGVAVDASHNVYIGGLTQSIDFPVTAGAYQTASGSSCSFLTKLNAAGTALTWSTYFGQSCSAEINAVAVDSQSAVYVTGSAFAGLPVTGSAPQQTFGGGLHDAFLAKVASAGNSLAYCTYLGGSQSDSGTGIAVDANGNAYATGFTQSSDFPVTPLALQTTSGGGYDAFVAELDSAGDTWVYVTYLGGTGDDFSYGIALDPSGDAYVAGYTVSSDFPMANAVQGALAGNAHVLYKTTSTGKNWSAADSGLPTTPLAMVVDPESNSHWLAATPEGLYQSTDSGKQWQAISYFSNSYMYGVAFSPQGGAVYASVFTNIYSSSDSGNTWTFAGVAPCAASSLAVSPITPTTLYLGSSCAAQSTDGGQNWLTIDSISGYIYTMAIDPQSDQTVYAGTSSGLFGSTDGGQTWNQLNLAGLQYPSVTSLAINPSAPADLYAVANGAVYLSTNSGSTWSQTAQGLSVQVNAVAVAPAAPSNLYAATTAGVYTSSNSGGSWKAAGETGNSISLIAVGPQGSATAFAATSVNSDAFVSEIASGGFGLVYSTYLGGTGMDYANGLALDSNGNAHVTGSVQSADFPSTTGAFQTATGSVRTTAFVSSIQSTTPSCSEFASPASAFFYASGGTANFGVSAPSGCSWTPDSSESWLTISSHGGPGAGPLAIAAAANKGSARTATMTIGRDKITVTQAASGCTYSLSAGGLAFAQTGGPQSIAIATGSKCGWVVTGLPLWLTANPTSGTGSGTVTLNAISNPFPGSRGGFPTIANTTVPSSQSGTEY
jgi:photosystem II stability/assembly factor-like uncharacterized protein